MSSTIFRLGSFLCCSASEELRSFFACCSVSSQILAPPRQPPRAFGSRSGRAPTGAGASTFPAMGGKLQRHGRRERRGRARRGAGWRPGPGERAVITGADAVPGSGCTVRRLSSRPRPPPARLGSPCATGGRRGARARPRPSPGSSPALPARPSRPARPALPPECGRPRPLSPEPEGRAPARPHSRRGGTSPSRTTWAKAEVQRAADGDRARTKVPRAELRPGGGAMQGPRAGRSVARGSSEPAGADRCSEGRARTLGSRLHPRPREPAPRALRSRGGPQGTPEGPR